MKDFLKKVSKFRDGYNFAMSIIAMLFLIGFLASVLIQVFSRTFLPKTPAWTEEIARYSFIYMVAFGSSVAVRTKEFVGIDMLTNFFSKTAQKTLAFIVSITLFCFSFFTYKKSVLVFTGLISKRRMVATATQIHMKYVYFSLVIFMGLLAFSYLLEILLSFSEEEKQKEVI